MEKWLTSGLLKKQPSDPRKRVAVNDESGETFRRNVRKYDRTYLHFGFTVSVESGDQCPQCVICCEKFSNQSMKPLLLQRLLKENTAIFVINLSNFLNEKIELQQN